MLWEKSMENFISVWYNKNIKEKIRGKNFYDRHCPKNILSCKLLSKLGFILSEKETLTFHKDEKGKAIFFEGGIFIKKVK